MSGYAAPSQRVLIRRYYDGAVLYDPVDNRTFSIPPEAGEILQILQAFIAEGATDRDRLTARIQEEIADADPAEPTPSAEAEHLSQWIDLAFRLER